MVLPDPDELGFTEDSKMTGHPRLTQVGERSSELAGRPLPARKEVEDLSPGRVG